MSTEITLVIITSVASLLVAIISLINSIIGNRQSAHLAKALETLKFGFEKRKSTQAVADASLTSALESLDILIQAIQRMKDIVQLILAAKGTSLDSESAMKSISDAREHLFDTYEEQLANLRTTEAKGAHKAKNLALGIETRLRDYLGDEVFVSSLSSYQKKILTELRGELTDAQNLLRDSRTTQLLKRLGATDE